MANKVYKITKDIPLFGLKKGQKARLSEATAAEYGLKEYKPGGKKAPDEEQGTVANAN